MADFNLGALILYKSRPAKVIDLGEKIEIEFAKKKTKKVRAKDIIFLHQGPIEYADKIVELDIDVTEAWELLAGEEAISLAELSDLLFDEQDSAVNTWNAWLQVAKGIYFEGTPDAIIARDQAIVEKELKIAQEKAEKETQWQDFLARLQKAQLNEADRKELADVEQLALRKTEKSRILFALNLPQTPESAHQMLIKWGYWTANFNPYPLRFDINLANPDLAIPALPEESRQDLTHLACYAIDDEDSTDPDDAISLDETGKIWVHIADVAAIVKADSELDIEAQSRSANLYLPERVIHMLPPAITEQLALGLQETSPALSIGFNLSAEGCPEDIEIILSLIKVQRTTYNVVAEKITKAPYQALDEKLKQFRAWRFQQGATNLDLPECALQIRDGKVSIKSLPALSSRDLVADAMIAAGYAVAKFTQENKIPSLYATQQDPEEIHQPETLSGHFAYRRFFKPSKVQTVADKHFGLGLPAYTRVTSPLRRYSDLLVHQQLRAFLAEETLQTTQQLTEKMAVASNEGRNIRGAERFSNSHWKCIYFKQNPQWQGEGVVVELDERKMLISIPELAYETKLRVDQSLKLDDKVKLRLKAVEIPEATAYFQIC